MYIFEKNEESQRAIELEQLEHRKLRQLGLVEPSVSTFGQTADSSYSLQELLLNDVDISRLPNSTELLAKVRAIDPAYDLNPVLSEVTLTTLRQMYFPNSHGAAKFGIYKRNPTAQQQVEIARGVALANVPYTGMDRIAGASIRRALESFAPRGLSITGVYRTFDSWEELEAVLTDKEPYRKIVLEHSKGGNSGLQSTVQIPFTFAKSPTDKAHLVYERKLSLKWSWRPVGTSKLKRAHRELAELMNQAMEESHLRQQWADLYLSSKPQSGLSVEELKRVNKAMLLVYSLAPDLSALTAGVSFGDDYIHMTQRSRAYVVRCDTCKAPVSLEIIWNLKNEKRFDWKSESAPGSEEGGGPEGSETVSSLLEDMHSPKCSGVYRTSSRTGKTFARSGKFLDEWLAQGDVRS